MRSSRTFRGVCSGAGLLLACGLAWAGQRGANTSVYALRVDPPSDLTVQSLIPPAQASAVDPVAPIEQAEPIQLTSDIPPVSFAPVMVDAAFEPVVIEGQPIPTAREPGPPLTTEPLSIPLPAFGVAGLLGLGGMMCWLGAKWLRIRP